MCRAHMHTVRKYFQKVQKMLNLSIPPQNKIITQARQGKSAVAFCHRSHYNRISKVIIFLQNILHILFEGIFQCVLLLVR